MRFQASAARATGTYCSGVTMAYGDHDYARGSDDRACATPCAIIKTMQCPICKKAVTREDQHYPFCSERCQLIDLGNWASEKYVVFTPIIQPREDEETE